MRLEGVGKIGLSGESVTDFEDSWLGQSFQSFKYVVVVNSNTDLRLGCYDNIEVYK